MIFVAATIPFGMLAVVALPAVGGLSLLAVNVGTAALVGLGCLALVVRLLRGVPIRMEPATFALIIFAIYTVFSATILVRLFAGEIMVFSLSRDGGGVRVSTQFLWGKVWLRPANSNISQTFYIVLACGFFVAAAHQLRLHGAAFGVRCLTWAASVNIVLGVLDVAALDTVMAVIRTANYSLLNEASVHGIPRIIGGFSESSSFGATSAGFFAFFASLAVRGGKRRYAVLGIANGIFACLALSATGLVAMAVAITLIATQMSWRVPQQMSRKTILIAAITLATVAIGVTYALLMTPAPEIVLKVVDDLILSKSQSSSGLERSAWAMGGLEAFRESYGLGVGAGSLRSNGLVFVLLGSVGLPGTLAFATFLWLAFSGRAIAGQDAIFKSARLSALIFLISMLLSATVADPGVPLMFLAALAIATRRYPGRISESTHISTVQATRAEYAR